MRFNKVQAIIWKKITV